VSTGVEDPHAAELFEGLHIGSAPPAEHEDAVADHGSGVPDARSGDVTEGGVIGLGSFGGFFALGEGWFWLGCGRLGRSSRRRRGERDIVQILLLGLLLLVLLGLLIYYLWDSRLLLGRLSRSLFVCLGLDRVIIGIGAAEGEGDAMHVIIDGLAGFGLAAEDVGRAGNDVDRMR
jgi:hypothetical protein